MSLEKSQGANPDTLRLDRLQACFGFIDFTMAIGLPSAICILPQTKVIPLDFPPGNSTWVKKEGFALQPGPENAQSG